VHCNVRNDDESATKDSQPNDIFPQREVVEAKSRQDGRAGNFDVETIAVVLETQLSNFVDDKAFIAVVEY
jgi:hypothetical protein